MMLIGIPFRWWSFTRSFIRSAKFGHSAHWLAAAAHDGPGYPHFEPRRKHRGSPKKANKCFTLAGSAQFCSEFSRKPRGTNDQSRVMPTIETPHPRTSVSHVVVDAMLDCEADEEYATNSEGRALPSA